ncbi:MAG: pyridoxamine 5'-phosphate oxidase family protein [Candidatus Heimdallarchaeota archaeon]|nr:MAG: pyridoxamine 5'-phosphate oxidase family protein [Candidatus Heimdallarchaeota archaeon]
MKVTCELNGHVCELPEFLTEFFIHSSILYCSTITGSKSPHIQPAIFINEPGKCSIVVLANSKSVLVKNLYQNTKTSLTIDKVHPLNPFLNKGIMIEAISHITDSKDAIKETLKDFERKYSFEVVTKILGIDIVRYCVKIRVLPLKIIYWEGPTFQRFRCRKRKSINA